MDILEKILERHKECLRGYYYDEDSFLYMVNSAVATAYGAGRFELQTAQWNNGTSYANWYFDIQDSTGFTIGDNDTFLTYCEYFWNFGDIFDFGNAS